MIRLISYLASFMFNSPVSVPLGFQLHADLIPELMEMDLFNLLKVLVVTYSV